MSNGKHTTCDLGDVPVSWVDLVANAKNAQSDEEHGGLLSNVWAGDCQRA